jgi:hypothetical protein
MSAEAVRSLVQIHYHNRPGGVTQVMRGYAAAFRRIAGEGSRSIIVCGNHDKQQAPDVVSLVGCDYRRFRTAGGFEKVVVALVNQLVRIITDPALPCPVCVIGHNLCLGKNVALAEAFTRVAQELGGATGNCRFFTVVHDFAEEGRVRLTTAHQRMRNVGVPVDRALYPSVNVRYMALAPRNCRLLKKVGAPVVLLSNPVIDLKTPDLPRAMVVQALQKIALHDGVGFKPDRPILFYPVRVIGRKNVAEAIFVSLLLDANLVIGGAGTAPSDLRLYESIRAYARNFHLPLVLDVGRIGPQLTRATGQVVGPGILFPLLYKIVDCCLTTSVAEGFGYALHEPWVYHCGVIGRAFDGFVPLAGMAMDHLYQRLPMPVSWIDVEELVAHYAARLPGVNRHRITRTLVVENSVDFGRLAPVQQLSIVKRLANDPGHISVISNCRTMLAKQVRSATTASRISRNCCAIASAAGEYAFDRRFAAVLNRHTDNRSTVIDAGLISRYFMSMRRTWLVLD